MFGSKSAPATNGRDDLTAAIEEFRAKAAAAIEKIRQEDAANTLSDSQRVEKAKQFVKESGVASALTSVWRDVQHYPSWSKRDDFARFNPLEVTNVDGGKTHESRGSTETVSFDWKGRRWAFALMDSGHSSYDGDDKYAVLCLQINGDTAYEANIRKSYSVEYDDWNAFDVRALSIGPWVGDLVEAQQIFTQAQRRRMQELQSARVADQASKIKF